MEAGEIPGHKFRKKRGSNLARCAQALSAMTVREFEEVGQQSSFDITDSTTGELQRQTTVEADQHPRVRIPHRPTCRYASALREVRPTPCVLAVWVAATDGHCIYSEYFVMVD